MTVATKWTLTANSTLEEVTAWLNENSDSWYIADILDNGLVDIQFGDLELAFKFRIQFDENIIAAR